MQRLTLTLLARFGLARSVLMHKSADIDPFSACSALLLTAIDLCFACACNADLDDITCAAPMHHPHETPLHISPILRSPEAERITTVTYDRSSSVAALSDSTAPLAQHRAEILERRLEYWITLCTIGAQQNLCTAPASSAKYMTTSVEIAGPRTWYGQAIYSDTCCLLEAAISNQPVGACDVCSNMSSCEAPSLLAPT